MAIEIGKEKAEICKQNASLAWRAEAYRAFVYFARRKKTFTTGEVRRWLEENKKIFPHDGRAWGGIAMQAQRADVVRRTGKFVYTGSHGRPDAIWKSMLFK